MESLIGALPSGISTERKGPLSGST